MNEKMNQLYLQTSEGDYFLETENYFFNKDGSSRKEIKNFVQGYMNLSPQEIFQLQEKISSLHCEHEMNFQIKDPSGQYSKVVSTPLQGFAPVSFQLVQQLVDSTQKPLNLLRSLLQEIYSKKELKLEDFTKFNIAQDDAQTLLKIIQENIYYEPNIVHPNLKDYPFLPLVGFDAALSSLSKPQTTFFEYNAGTPCGIEDQYQLFHHLKSLNLKFFQDSNLDQDWDNSHYLLRNVIEECANEWTQKDEGICVVMSPGPYSPAHPEIAALAVRAKMPLVRMNDLYIDEAGYVRFNCLSKQHPLVKGIYNRREESFLIYSEQSKIPLRSPFYRDINQRISQKQNLKLHPGILYSYLYDTQGTPEAVELNDKGEPIYQTLFDQIGVHPKTNLKGDIAQALIEKKVFISNIGGRILDDKRVFRILDKTFKTHNVAHPPQGISATELENKMNQAVIKIPDQSGGAGVLIGPCLDAEQRKEIIKKVQQQPHFYEIQNLEKLAVIPTVTKEQNDYKYQTLPVDWRLIIFQSPTGKVSWSQHSCLVRTAGHGDIKTNTSAGGGYAIGLIYDQGEQDKKTIKEYPYSYIGKQKAEEIDSFFIALNKFLETNDFTQVDPLTYQYRDIMDCFELKKVTWIQKLRDYRDKKITKESFKNYLKETFPDKVSNED